MLLIIVFMGVNVTSTTAGNNPKYKVIDIPKELKSGALAVIRNQEIVFVRKSLSGAVLEVTEVITILNKKAIDDATFAQYYDKFSKIKRIRAVIYDEYGEVVKKIENDDIMDISAISGGTLFSDARIKLIDPEYRTIPFTVEYSYEIVYSGLLNYPEWIIYPSYKTAIEKSSFSVTTPGNLQLRYYQRNIDIKPNKSVDNGEITFKWEVSNLKALKKEPFSLSLFETAPSIISAPSEFSVDGVAGNLSSWKEFGSWRAKLLYNRDELPEETKNEIESMLNDSITEYETVKMLYNWMQDKTRYVSIQEGIGGWQPMLAEDVDRFSYGDCKALSNYMLAILKVANINSYYTVVNAGASAHGWIADFPSNQSNHAILCVPIEEDTVWLECTSQQIPFGYIGDFTDDRDVLIITEDGGKIVHTTVYDKEDNFKVTKAIVSIDEYGDGFAKIDVTNNGLYYEDLVSIILSNEKDRNEIVTKGIDIPSFELENYSFTETKSIIPLVEEEINLKLKSYATKLGKRLLFEVNLLNKHNYQFKRSGNRKNDVVIRREFKEIDTVVFSLPENYSLESLPKPIEVNSEFGDYSTQIIADSTSLTYIRNFEVNKGSYPNTSYTDFKKFSADIRNADNQKVVLIRNSVE